MPNPDTTWIAAIVVTSVVSCLAWRLRALDLSGFVAATVAGSLIVGTAGWWTGVLLVAFFVTGSALSQVSRMGPEDTQHRGSRRDAIQVLANGGVPCLLAIGSGLAADPAPWLVGCGVSIAAATSDTWATETGRISRAQPKRLLTWSPAPAGTSGAVSGPGTIGGLAGSLLIGLLAWYGSSRGLWSPVEGDAGLVATIALAGFVGCVIDSVLGRSLQAVNWCPTCARPTEQAIHRCGTSTIPNGGVRWMNNDLVNLLSILVATGGGSIVSMWWM